MEKPDDMKIKAMPVKEFFISIITRDITLLDAINDLIDNSVDGGRNLRKERLLEIEAYKGLRVLVRFDQNSFEIADNCGGIDYITAKEFAFRFGRDESAPSVDGSIGRFGVGMKRALFKLGKVFDIESTSKTSKFSIHIDIDEWKAKIDDNNNEVWEFEFQDVVVGEEFPEEEWGTKITVTQLDEAIAADFKLVNFSNKLIDSVSSKHEQSMTNGFEININDIPLKYKLSKLINSREIHPIKVTKVYPLNPGAPDPDRDVKVTLFAGVVPDPIKSEAGWYIICNGRQVLRADQSNITGWDEVMEDGRTIPKAHYQFYKFRGYVFFESKDAGALPWNTAKSGLDAESKIYKAARFEMITAMRQIIDFLNKLDKETSGEDGYLTQMVDSGCMGTLGEIPENNVFVYPSAPRAPSKPKTVRVSCNRVIEEVEFAKNHFGVTTVTKVGECVFDYFIDRERE